MVADCLRRRFHRHIRVLLKPYGQAHIVLMEVSRRPRHAMTVVVIMEDAIRIRYTRYYSRALCAFGTQRIFQCRFEYARRITSTDLFLAGFGIVLDLNIDAFNCRNVATFLIRNHRIASAVLL